jgi:putative inorganic carbon (hco3(-)) transporter
MPASTDRLPVQRAGSRSFPGELHQGSIPIRRRAELSFSALTLALLSPFAALRAKSVQQALLAVVVLDIPLQLGTHLFYREVDAASGALAGLSISATTLALIGLYGSWFLEAMESRGQKPRVEPRRNWALLCYLGFNALSVLVARDARLSFFGLFLLFQTYLVFLYVTRVVRTRSDVLFVVSWLLWGCLIESVLMVALGVGNVGAGLWGPLHIRVDHEAGSEFTRVGGTIGSPNEAGAYLSVLLAIGVSVLLARVARKYKWLAAMVLAAGGAALVLTFSRGAWTAFAVATSIVFVSIARRKKISFKPLVAIAAILLVLYLPFQSEINARLFADDNGSAESRVPLMKLAFRMIADNPILGVGSNNFSAAMDDYVSSEFRNGFLYTVHNKYLLVWAETGPGGLLAYLAFLIGMVRMGRACWKKGDGFLGTLALGLSAAIAGNMVHQGVEILQDRAMTQLLCLMAGLLAVIDLTLRERPADVDAFGSIT